MILCIDLGATNVKGALVENGELYKQAKFPTEHFQGLGGIVRSLKRTIEELGTRDVRGISFASAGDIDSERAVCTYSTGNLEDFLGFDFKRFAMENYSLNAVAINDAHAALLGEMAYGAGKALAQKNTVMLTLGSGVGGGYWKDGALCATKENDYARFGHIVLHEGGVPCNCGKIGCVEQYLSGRAINRLALSYGLDAEGIFSAYLQGDERGAQAMQKLADDLALALEKIDRVSPFEACILGGGVSEGMRDCLAFFQARTPKQLVLAELGNRAGVLGAYAFSLGKL